MYPEDEEQAYPMEREISVIHILTSGFVNLIQRNGYTEKQIKEKLATAKVKFLVGQHYHRYREDLIILTRFLDFDVKPVKNDDGIYRCVPGKDDELYYVGMMSQDARVYYHRNSNGVEHVLKIGDYGRQDLVQFNEVFSDFMRRKSRKKAK